MKVRDILNICKPVWNDNGRKDDDDIVVSVLLPTFRRGKNGLLDNAIQSVLRQDYQKWELIIIDDASTDGSEDIIRRYMQDDSRVRTIRHTYNIGLPAISEYEGICKAKGKYIAFIFDENEWERDYLAKTVAFMERTGANVSYGRVRLQIDTTGDNYIELGKKSRDHLSYIQRANGIPNGAVVARREIFYDPRVGLYDPHIASIKLCDWSLWKRAGRVYLIQPTDIVAGDEWGAVNSDSLGNSYSYTADVTIERESEIQYLDLSVDQFENIDVLEVREEASQQYRDAVDALHKRFANKKWYTEPRQTDKTLRIGVIGNMDPTMLLTFARYSAFPEISERYLFVFLGVVPPAKSVLLYDAIVFSRTVDDGGICTICRENNIPVYYYADDNFDKTDSGAVWSRETLQKFDDYLISTEKLGKYLEDTYKIPDDHVFLLPVIYNIAPMYGKETLHLVQNKEIVIAFLGGQWRNSYFITEVLPALRKVAKNRKVTLIRTDDPEYERADWGDIQCVEIERTPDTNWLLTETKQYKPNVLIHCGYNESNNDYKTHNALWNATALGAVLMVNDVEPYKSPDVQEHIFMFERSDEIAERLLAIADRTVDQQLSFYAETKEYLRRTASVQNALQALNAAFENVQPTDDYDLKLRLLNQQEVAVASDGQPRRVDSERLAFTGGITGKAVYYVTCIKENPDRVGLILAREKALNVSGSLDVCITCGRDTLLDRQGIDLAELQWNNWTYFDIPRQENMRLKRLRIELRFHYGKGSVHVGVFEDRDRVVSHGYLRRRLGLYSSRPDILFADC